MKRQAYPSDLSDAQWARLEKVFPPPKNGRSGRPRRYPLREVVNALLYQARTGCSYRALPHDLPPWNVVWDHFRRWRDNGTLELIHSALRSQGLRNIATKVGCGADFWLVEQMAAFEQRL